MSAQLKRGVRFLLAAMGAYQSSTDVTNPSGKHVLFCLEPWGEQIDMPPNTTFIVCAEADRPGRLEVEYGDNQITVWAWPTSTVSVFSGDTEIGMTAGFNRPTVPEVPEGQTVRLFLGTMLGGETPSNNREIEQHVGPERR